MACKVKRLVVERPDGIKEIFGLADDPHLCPEGHHVPVKFDLYDGLYVPVLDAKHHILYRKKEEPSDRPGIEKEEVGGPR